MSLTLPAYRKYSNPDCGRRRLPSAKDAFLTRCAIPRCTSSGTLTGPFDSVDSPPPPTLKLLDLSCFSGGTQFGSLTDCATLSECWASMVFFAPLMRSVKSVKDSCNRISGGPYIRPYSYQLRSLSPCMQASLMQRLRRLDLTAQRKHPDGLAQQRWMPIPIFKSCRYAAKRSVLDPVERSGKGFRL